MFSNFIHAMVCTRKSFLLNGGAFSILFQTHVLFNRSVHVVLLDYFILVVGIVIYRSSFVCNKAWFVSESPGLWITIVSMVTSDFYI